MQINYQQNMTVLNWIFNNTSDSSVVVELGAGFLATFHRATQM